MRVMFLIPGINQDGDAYTWPLEMSPIVNQRGGGWCAQPFVYEATALTVDAKQSERINTLSKLFSAYEGCERHATMHSNGNRVGVGAWRASGAKFKTLHMLCGACNADFEALGLNAGLLDGSIEQIFCYVATADTAMRIEDTLPGDLLFGIPLGGKPLGLDGPRNVNPAISPDRVQTIRWTGYDHSTCWDDEHFDGTVTQVMANAEGNIAVFQSAVPPVAPPAPLLTPREQGEQIERTN